MKSSRVTVTLILLLVPIASAAAPQGSRLLAMVPDGVQIVTGLKVTREAESRAQIALVTHDNNVDFDDWLALISVDPQKRGREVVEAAASSPRGQLRERLLLVDGNFDAEHIYRAALKGGASAAEYAGVRVLILLPFARENDVRIGVRWLAIPDDSTALFGTPLLVQRALNRRAAHAKIDEALATRLKQLRPDVDDWSVLAMPSDEFTRNLRGACYPAAAIEALVGSEELVMGIRYGSTATIDFVAHSERDLPSTINMVNAKTELNGTGLNPGRGVHLERFVVDGRRVMGTVKVSGSAMATATANETTSR